MTNLRHKQKLLISAYDRGEPVPLNTAIKMITGRVRIDKELVARFFHVVRHHDAELFHPQSPAEYWIERWQNSGMIPQTFIDEVSAHWADWDQEAKSWERTEIAKKALKSRKRDLTGKLTSKSQSRSERKR